MRESQIEKALVRRVKLLGGEVRKVAWINRRGAPDRFVMLQGPDKNIWVELKAPGGVLEDHQAREHERMRVCGEKVIVIDSLELVDRWFPVPPPLNWRDYEMNVRLSNTLQAAFPDKDLAYVAGLSDLELRRVGLRVRDVKELREVAGNAQN